jgi:hypothetical protein
VARDNGFRISYPSITGHADFDAQGRDFEIRKSEERARRGNKPAKDDSRSPAQRQALWRWADGAALGGQLAQRMRKLRGCSQMRGLLKALDTRRPEAVDGATLKAA